MSVGSVAALQRLTAACPCDSTGVLPAAAQAMQANVVSMVAEGVFEQFPTLKLVTIADLGGWPKNQQEHFADGGTFDQIYSPGR